MKNKMILAAALMASLAACGAKKDSAYFETNTAERDAKIASCRNDPGGFREDGECIAAMAAELVLPARFWLMNDSARLQKLDECERFVETLGKLENCRNAAAAAAAKLGGGKVVNIN